jgi:uncharacterized protein (TIGR03067 family)
VVSDHFLRYSYRPWGAPDPPPVSLPETEVVVVKSLLVCLVALVATGSYAEVIELEGTIKSIDKDARAISITRKTPKGEKVLELEVAKNAGDISGFKEGDKIDFAYNPDAEIVTKIEKGLSEEGKRALKDLEGVWMAVKVDRHGTMMTPKELREQSRRIIIEGNTVTFEETRDGKVVNFGGPFTADPEKKTFDFTGKGPMGADFIMLAIYEVNGDELKFCYRRNADGTAKRPTEFKADDEKKNFSISYTCKRLKLD